MKPRTLRYRSLVHYRRTNVAIALGVAAGTAALTGALVVGDSMRGSLREIAVGRLGPVEFAFSSQRFFRDELARDIAQQPGFHDKFAAAAPIILMSGSITHADTRALVHDVNIIGVEDSSWFTERQTASSPVDFSSEERAVVLNKSLAERLDAQPEDAILLRFGKPSTVSTETILGRRDDTTLTARLKVRGIADEDSIAGFSLSPQHATPLNVLVPLSRLQRALDRPGRVNTILVTHSDEGEPDDTDRSVWLKDALTQSIQMEDLELNLRQDSERGYVALESDRFLLEPPAERSAMAAAQEIGATTSSVLAYLANEIAVVGGGATVPYSTVAAVDGAVLDEAGFRLLDGSPAPPLQSGELYLNKWTADALDAESGDAISLSYYVTADHGRLDTQSRIFTLRSVVQMTEGVADPGFVPEYPDVTDTDNIADWNPPFPVDLEKIQDRDENYWDRYRAAPKAFTSLAEGQALWADDPERFGDLTSIRVTPPEGMTLDALQAELRDAFLKNVDPVEFGLRFDDVRSRALAAGKGSTDFGGLFIGFSFFLILASAMLVALLFRLAVERRATELGLLLAVGFSPRRVAVFLLCEGLIVAGVGAAVGVLAASGYAWLMLAGLRSWWSQAVNAPFLQLHGTALSYVIGYAAGLAVATISIAWSIRGLTRRPASALIAGAVESGAITGRRGRIAPSIAVGAVLLAVIVYLLFRAEALSESVAFFTMGASVLIAAMAAIKAVLSSEPRRVIQRAGFSAVARLGARNARRHPGRSMLTIGLIASATFVIAALQAFRIETDTSSTEKTSPTGGFALYAESAVPLQFDLNTEQGREQLNIGDETDRLLADATVFSCRLRPGDESSCLNLYKPTEPRIIGVRDDFLQRAAFIFSTTLAEDDAEHENPWRLLEREFEDGAVPVIADEAAAKWQLHVGLGKDLVVSDERGRQVPLRFVALLKGSALQDELIVSNANFARLFPSITGSRFFLIETPSEKADAMTAALERDLTDFGFDVARTADRLRNYSAVQNTYLSTFQTLGGLGLILGTIGLAAVMLRNVLERRGELALMRAVGFASSSLVWMVLLENAALVAAGLLVGAVSAAVAVLPHLAERPEALPLASVGFILAAVFVVAMISGLFAVLPTLRAPLLPALRNE